ncbi:hypothetical protein VTK26DRAFT_4910 [Humicola hyalothermophila]
MNERRIVCSDALIVSRYTKAGRATPGGEDAQIEKGLTRPDSWEKRTARCSRAVEGGQSDEAVLFRGTPLWDFVDGFEPKRRAHAMAFAESCILGDAVAAPNRIEIGFRIRSRWCSREIVGQRSCRMRARLRKCRCCEVFVSRAARAGPPTDRSTVPPEVGLA